MSLIITSTNCGCFKPITVVGDSPIAVSDLITGQYTVKMSIANATGVNNTIVEIITVSGNDNPINSTIVKTVTASDICTSAEVVTPTNGLSSESMFVYTVGLYYEHYSFLLSV